MQGIGGRLRVGVKARGRLHIQGRIYVWPISLAQRLFKMDMTYEQVVTTALSFSCTRHFKELHRRWKSMVYEGEVGG